MNTRSVGALGLMASVVLACGGKGEAGPLADDLKRDLEATSTQLELAGQSGPAMRFVSELEQGKTAEPVERSRTPRRVAANNVGVQPEQQSTPAPEVQQEVQVAQAVSEAPQAPQPVPDAPSVPMVAPRPVSLPVDMPTEGTGRGGMGGAGVGSGDYGGGIGIGDVIGVVIRGGGVGPDHCPPPRRRPPPRRGIP